jgi:hypothetical protein
MPRTRSKNTTPVAKVRHSKAKARYSQIKKYVNFKFQDTDHGARKIREIYNELWPLLHQPHTDYTPRSNRAKKVAISATGIRQRKAYKKIPVPTSGVEGITVKVKNDQLIVESDFLSQQFIPFNKRALAQGAANHVNKLLSKFGDRDLFKIQTGNYEIAVSYTKNFIAAEVEKLQLKYQVGAQIPGRGTLTRGQSWHAWLNGVIRFEVANQKDTKTVRARIAARDKAKKQSYKANKKTHIK